jgi:hypothetical protein
MLALLTFGILILTILILLALRFVPRGEAFSWLASALGSLAAWASVFFWQVSLPQAYALGPWVPVSLFRVSPSLSADSAAWMYALSLTGLAAAIILSSPARILAVSPMAWTGTLLLAALGLLAVLADNPLTLVMAWTALDLAELVNTLWVSRGPAMNERSVISLTMRALGTGFVLWASVLSAASGQPFSFDQIPSVSGLYLLLAAGLRLGVLPLHLAFPDEPVLRRGFGTALRLSMAVSSLALLRHIPAGVLPVLSAPILLVFTALAALYGGWKWVSAPDELAGRPYWLIGMGALAVTAAVRGNSLGSAAWGNALVLFGGLSFLYSARQIWYTRALSILAAGLVGLPFTLTATGWQGSAPWDFIFWPFLLTAQALLAGGYLRHTLRPGESELSEAPRWAQASYPTALIILAACLLLGGLWGWDGVRQVGVWGAAIVTSLLTGALALAYLRLPGLLAPGTAVRRRSLFSNFQAKIAGVLWNVYRFLGRVVFFFSDLLEGDGGLLWTLLLLVILVTLFQGR